MSNFCQENFSEWILEGDIKGCFDNISHDWMLENIPVIKNNEAILEVRLCGE